MVFVGDDFAAILIVEGREVWRVEGAWERRPVCTSESCGLSWPEGDEPEDGECECGAPTAYGDAFTCSECDRVVVGYEHFKDHAESHIPSHF